LNNLLIGKGPIKNDLLPFPFDFTSVAGLFVLMTSIRSRNEMIRFGGTGGIRNLFGHFHPLCPVIRADHLSTIA
jgi:hypothetical protein